MNNLITKPVRKTTEDLLREHAEIFDAIQSAEGELTPELESRILMNTQMIADKADAIDYALNKLDAEEAFLKSQAKAYSDAAKSRANTADRIRKRIKELMASFGVDKLRGGTTEFSLVKGRKIIEGSGIPDGYGLIVTETIPDKERIEAELREGKSVDGWSIRDSVSLRSKVTVTEVRKKEIPGD
jgi:hypothetical protein